MNLPDCYDPVYQEERRQAEWDKFVKKLPVCACCGNSVRPGDVYYRLTLGKKEYIMCDECKEELDDSRTYFEI